MMCAVLISAMFCSFIIIIIIIIINKLILSECKGLPVKVDQER